MKISCKDLGKRFNRDWIFRHVDYEFSKGNTYAITGPNGSGKSTLLQVLSGAMMNSTGKISYYHEPGNTTIPEDSFYRYISIAAPYVELVEEMTFTEFLAFHNTFKPFLAGLSIREIIERVDLQKAAEKQIRQFSSGMKQRVKLAQAIFSATPCLFLDEPCTNFDETGYRLYRELMEMYTGDRLVIISSNDQQEYTFADEVISVLDYK